MFSYNSIMNKEIGPVYLHCWNGWHQSGFVSAVLLKQFCGFSTETALHYWEDCADNWTRGYDRIRNAIRDFEPVDKYNIPIEIKEAICPCYEDERSNDVVVVQNNNDELKSLNITVLFPSNVSDLPPSVSTFLDEYAAMLKENNYLNIEVGGHTDSKGTKEHNLQLSGKRAKNVLDYEEFDITPRVIKKAEKAWSHYANNVKQDETFDLKKEEIDEMLGELKAFLEE